MLLLLVAACPGGDDKGEGGLEREELGTFTTDTGFGVDIPVDVPEGAVSSLLTCGPYGYDTLATVETLTNPSGSVVFSMEDPEATPYRALVHDDLVPALLPLAPELDVTSGTWLWRLYLDVEAATTVTCHVVHRVDEVGSARSVDLHFVFVGVELTAVTADNDATFTAALAGVDDLWGPAGLTVGAVTYEDFSGDVDTYASVDGDQEFGDLVRTANLDGGRLIPVFVVDAITADGETILGQAGGPPGAAAVGGTAKSGVVVTAGWIADQDAGQGSRLLAHELFHFLGLFHPISKDGLETDPLDDTPVCTNDADGSGTFSSEECSGAGTENLMWWATNESSTTLTADQAWVPTRSAAAR